MLCILLLITACTTTPPKKEIIYVPIEETTVNRDSLNRLVHELELNRLRADSVNVLTDSIHVLNELCDSISRELLIKNIKLERIRYYNTAAGKGNNIVFLRGWINRVLDEND